MKRILVWCTVTFLLGIFASVRLSADWIPLFAGALLVILIKGLFGRERHFILLLCMCLSFLTGAMEVELLSAKTSQFLELYQDQYVYIYGKIAEEPDVREDHVKLTVQCQTIELEDEKRPSEETVLVSVASGDKKWNYGDIISVEGIIERPLGEMNDMGFSYESYLKSQGIAATMYCKEAQARVYRNEAGWLWKTKHFVLDKIDQFVQGDAGAMLKGIALGDRTSFTSEMNTAFSRAGITHIVVVSGMHMSVLMLFVMYICRRIGLGKRARAIAAAIAVIFFMLLIGCTPSVIRAGVTCIIAMLAVLLQRKKDFLTTMAVAAAIVTLLNPYSLFDVSFQLSFTATIGIVYLGDPVKKWFSFLPDTLAEVMAMSVAANIATLPVVVWYFSDVSLVAVLSNILVVPFVNFLFIGSFFLALAGSIFPPVAIALGFLMGTLSNMILAAVRQIASFSYATIALPRPHTMVMVYYYLAVYSLWMLSQRKKVLEMKVLLSCVCFLAVSFCVIQYWNTDALRLEFINVGQGDSCMVRLPNRRHILIDTGEKGTGTTNNVVDYLKKRGIYTLDCVFISHADSDHSGGLAEVLDNIHVKKVALPELNIRSGDMEKLIQMIQQYQIPIDFVSAGDSYQIEELEIKALWPIALSGSSSLVTDNNLSMVLRMTYQDITAMFMGDLGGEAEEMLVHSGTPLLCTILKVSHHGSSTGTGEAFLNAAWPKYSVISVGENNYGHPDSEVVGRLESHGSQILRTDVLGNIVFHIDRKGELTAESR